MSKKWDLIVIGAGIIGVTTAWMARKFHHKNVLLIEQKFASRGATAYALALRTPYFESANMQALVAKSKKIYEERIDVLPESASARIPSFWVIPEAAQDTLRRRLASDQLQVASRATQKELLRYLPGLQVSKDERLMYDPDDRVGSPIKTSEALLRDFLHDGGTIIEGVRYASCLEDSRGVNVVLSDGTCLSGTNVVVATGPWMAREFSSYLLPPVRSKKIIAFHIDEALRQGSPIVQWLEDDVFLAPDYARNRYLLSIRSNEWDVVPDDSRLSISETETAYARCFLSQHFPRFLNAIRGGRVFCDGYSRTSVPYVSRDPFTKGVYYAGAAGGAGYRLAPAIADNVLMLLGTGSLITNA
ncbi:FAD-dependent oxidoreductase [Pseudomonas sp. FP597]|uniref:NAD(P)/FAD-dependent oxidoreductase n=1 Tax=Pseudomonas sp. FP597 TaxID=2954096 RepID=UPI002733F608|nr:FAD-dependent oxidoreductase [Pseudomonas sp. FP597]WLI07437.1 FAD-dependent oxidoreductase [Pseudomonas sp. FP597]